jgi:ribosome-associated toxin RatA of RatAB toxin-antitoxin module
MKALAGTGVATVGATPEACFALVAAVDGYPRWYPEVIRSAEVLERDPAGWPSRARTLLHVSAVGLVRDFDLLMDEALEEEREVRLTRVADEPSDPERFEVVWRIAAGPPTRLELELAANLGVPRLVPLGGVGDRLAQGFVDAAKRALEGSSPNASASSS